ncbi:MAG: hypothetical protein Q6373_002140, partial [Candidatus Sigynarchaeota archaeon]
LIKLIVNLLEVDPQDSHHRVGELVKSIFPFLSSDNYLHLMTAITSADLVKNSSERDFRRSRSKRILAVMRYLPIEILEAVLEWTSQFHKRANENYDDDYCILQAFSFRLDLSLAFIHHIAKSYSSIDVLVPIAARPDLTFEIVTHMVRLYDDIINEALCQNESESVLRHLIHQTDPTFLEKGWRDHAIHMLSIPPEKRKTIYFS